MTDEIEDYDEQLVEIEEEIAKGVKTLSSASPEDQLKGIKNIEKRLQRGKELMDGFTIELRELSPSESGPFRTKQEEHDKNLKSLRSQVDGMKQTAERAVLGLDKEKSAETSAAAARPKTAMEAKAEADDLLNKGAEKQKDTLGVLGRVKEKIGETEQVGIAINTKLVEDREKMETIKTDLEEIDDGVKQSKKLVTQIARRLLRDQCIRAMLIVVLIGVLILIIWGIVQAKTKSGSSASSTTVSIVLISLCMYVAWT